MEEKVDTITVGGGLDPINRAYPGSLTAEEQRLSHSEHDSRARPKGQTQGILVSRENVQDLTWDNDVGDSSASVVFIEEDDYGYFGMEPQLSLMFSVERRVTVANLQGRHRISPLCVSSLVH